MGLDIRLMMHIFPPTLIISFCMVGEPSSCFLFAFSNRHFTSITEKKDISKA